MYRRHILGFLTLILAGIFAYLNTKALEESWFWVYPWFDLVMHFFGGVIIGGFLLYIYLSHTGNAPLLRSRKVLGRWILIPTAAIVVAWEVYEFVFNIFSENNYLIDTTIDIFLGLLGALIMYCLGRLTIPKTQVQSHEEEM